MREDERWPAAAVDESTVRLTVGRLVALVEERSIQLGVCLASTPGLRPPAVVEAELMVAAARTGAVDGILALVIHGMPPAPPPFGGGR